MLSFLVVGAVASSQVVAGSWMSRFQARTNTSTRGQLRSIHSQRRRTGTARRAGRRFRRLAACLKLLREAAAIGGRASALAYDGLTTGALLPPSATSALSGKSESQKAQEQ
ncbi:hypothetical protein [Streptomyces phaeochromogenes]|uniref:hypothetical protein n=1 Tax=Streptomyces phaeochromogenes TaxID=1923 RepID=UPI00386B0C4E|nr:hypothetical protein OHB08_12330 [Streptomyces phaeochromogenes]